MARIETIRLADSILLLEFPTQYELAATFLRFQEHYESRRFQGRIFTLEEYMDWYARQFGNFTYFQDWDGFNIPSSALEPFYAGQFDPLRDKEQRLLDLMRNEKGDFYIIGIMESANRPNDKGLRHEIAHALFHVDQDYREEVLKRLKNYDLKAISKELNEMGYSRKVIRDEIQAYLISDPSHLTTSATRPLAELSRELRTLYRQHSRDIRFKKS